MTNGPDNNKVVDLQQRQALQTQAVDRVGELIKQCRGIAQKRLAMCIGSLLDGTDDALFDLAEKGENNVVQTRYFDGMREVRRKRQLLERLFQENLTRNFANFGQNQSSAQDSEGPRLGGLALLDEKELEESLAVSAMAGKASNRFSRHLYALDQRMSVLAGGTKIDEDNNPAGPKLLCRAFQSTLVELEVDLHVKLLILKLFDKHVMGGLDQLYDEINQHLVNAGVLPQLKNQFASQRPGSAGTARAPMAPMPGADADVAAGDYDQVGGGPAGGHLNTSGYGPASAAEAELQVELYNTVRSLLASRRGMSGPGGAHAGYSGGGSGVIPGQSFATNDLINALSILQSQTVAISPSQGYVSAPQVPPTGQIKDELVGQLHRLGSGDEKHRITSADEDTIDLVGMLFEFILQDRNLPAEMQALLARLQIPYLKCAILDKAMFAKKEHPARLLLDELAQAGLAWSEESDKDGRFYDKVKSVVEVLLKDFDDDVQIFDRQLKDFRDFVGSSKKRAEVSELRAAEAARGRERLQGARKTAAREILTRIEGKNLPEVIRHILTRPWANVLVLTILRQGEGSHPWKTSLRVADELVWAALPKETDSERSRLRALVPELEKALRQGLAMVAYHDNDVRDLLGDLGKFYETQLNPAAAPATAEAPAEVPEEKAAAATVSATDVAPGLEVEARTAAESPAETRAVESAPAPAPAEDNFVDELARQSKQPDAEADPETEIRDEHYEIARAIKVGTWVEFRHGESRAERAKLSWISPISSKYLFVNRKGLKVADKTVWALASELRNGRAMMLEDVPLFDRALDAIVERLKTSVGQEHQEQVEDVGEDDTDPTESHQQP
ncbi:MAG: DUF1631 domain-containing protein [Lysobacterales bacterium]